MSERPFKPGDVDAWRTHALFACRDVFLGTVQDVHNSIVFGSPLTGSPGQPVASGNLRSSWQLVWVSPDEARSGTNVAYAPAIEHGYSNVGPIRVPAGKYMSTEERARMRPGLRPSMVGGSKSVASTIANFDRIVAKNARDVNVRSF